MIQMTVLGNASGSIPIMIDGIAIMNPQITFSRSTDMVNVWTQLRLGGNLVLEDHPDWCLVGWNRWVMHDLMGTALLGMSTIFKTT
jgi:hypothetical protein